MLKETIQAMLEAQQETDLSYSKSEKAGISEKNRRNGHSTKTVRSEYGEVDLTVSVRTAEHCPLALPLVRCQDQMTKQKG
ncbi:hypothetical protein HCH52_01105 [Oscillospiraceae bacterium HV4-5-C5C]|nr:hypothetical protein [Oscillospiraceae bacterium HV4-5-C5C]